jgi:hypothetical protein
MPRRRRFAHRRARERIGLLPDDPVIARLFRSAMIEHRLVEIGCYNARLPGQAGCNGPCERTGASRPFPVYFARHPLGEVTCVRFKDERDKKPIVDLGDISRKQVACMAPASSDGVCRSIA